MKCFIVVLAFIALSEALTDTEEWINFKSKFGKIYKSHVEELNRFNIFQNNLRRIESHNKKADQGLSSFRKGVTKFADLTPGEFIDLMKLSKSQKPLKFVTVDNLEQVEYLPDSVDWSKKGAVTPVKDQGQCGSCWSFSATGTLEGANFLANGALLSLSEQNLVDCDSECYRCGGGYMTYALEYVAQNGIMSEQDYPYEGIDEACKFNKSNAAVQISGYKQVKSGSEEELQTAVATIGPISVAIDASFELQLYSSGILDDTSCGNAEYDLNHGVLAVGYGSENGKDYWIVKNSWGKDWGMDGYVWMSRNKNNQCGISTDACYAVI